MGIIAGLAAVLSPVTGVLLLIGLVLLPVPGINGVVEIDAYRVVLVYALAYTSLPAALAAAVGAFAMFALTARRLSRSVVLCVGAVAGIVVLPPPGYHLFDVTEIVRSGAGSRPYTAAGLVNGLLWGVGIGYSSALNPNTRGVLRRREAGK